MPVLKSTTGHMLIPIRTKVCSESGALLEKPVRVRFGLIKVALIVAPFITMGGIISREFAAWLEENELFVPDDDDDD